MVQTVVIQGREDRDKERSGKWIVAALYILALAGLLALGFVSRGDFRDLWGGK